MADLKPAQKRVRFGDVVRLNKETCRDPAAEGIDRYVGLEDIEPGDLRVRSWGNVTAGTTFTNRVRPGQVLFGKRRAYQRKVAVADFDAVCSGDIYRFESTDPGHLLPGLLPFICQTDAFFEHAVATSAGSISPRTNWSGLASYEFALPSIEEQARLVRALSEIRRLHTAFIDTELSARTLFDRLALTLLIPPGTRFRQDSTLEDVPANWDALPIRSLCRANGDLAIGPFGSNLLNSDYAGRTGGVPIIFVRDIRPNRFGYVSDCFVSAEKALELKAHTACSGDLLVTKVGVPESMGTPPGLAAVLPPGFPTSIITADVVRARLDHNKALPEYVALVLNTPWGRQQTWRISPGSTTRFKMTLGNFSQIRLPIPAVGQQRKVIQTLHKTIEAGVSARRRAQATQQLARNFLRPS